MLKITIPGTELWDDANEIFIPIKGQTLVLEHSLISLSKWESKWCKPFLDTKEKTYEETLDYVKCMTITQGVDPHLYNCINNKIMQQINDYIAAPMTATTISSHRSGGNNGEAITAELIYYWMICLGIPFECQKWHLNKLLMLIRVCNEKNKPSKKMTKGTTLKQNHALNAARRKRYHTKG